MSEDRTNEIVKAYKVKRGRSVADAADLLNLSKAYVSAKTSELVAAGKLAIVGKIETGKRGRPANLYSSAV